MYTYICICIDIHMVYKARRRGMRTWALELGFTTAWIPFFTGPEIETAQGTLFSRETAGFRV